MVVAVPSRTPWLRSTPLRVPALGPGLDQPLIEDRLASVAALPEVWALVLFGSRSRGKAHLNSDLDLVVVVRGALTPELERQVWRRIRALLLPALPVDLDLVIVEAAAAEKLSGSRWHVLGHAYREGVVVYAA
jgi:predicted nucleotidyltransferase